MVEFIEKSAYAANAAGLLKLATAASVTTATTLIVVKFGAWFVTGSVSVLASLMDSLLDAVASLINLIAVRYSLTPADEEHRFGHGKAEFLAGLAQSAFIAGSAIFLVLISIDRLFHPQPIHRVGVGVGIMVFSIVATAVLLGIQHYVIRRTQSVAIRADALHYATDFLTNLGVIIALSLTVFGWPRWDAVIALAIALYILYGAWTIGHEAFQLLLDRELSREVRKAIEAIALAHRAVVGVHELRTRQSGRTKFIQLHLELDGEMPLARAHAIGDEVEQEIRGAFPDAEVLIHHDPASWHKT